MSGAQIPMDGRADGKVTDKDSVEAPPVQTSAPDDSMQAPSPRAKAQANSELQEYLHVSQQRRRLFPRAALVGLLAGLMAVIFRMLLAGGDAARNSLLAWAHRVPVIGWLFPMVFSATGAALSVLLVRRFAPEAAGSGTMAAHCAPDHLRHTCT